MKYLKPVNKINTYALGIFFAALFIGMIRPNEFETLLMSSAVVLFFITFICGGLTFSCANRVAVNMGTADLSVVPKRRMIILAVVCVSEIAAMLLFIQNSIVIWAIGVLVISYFFTAQEYCIILEIEKSEKFKVSFPVVLVPVAVISVFVGEIIINIVFDTFSILLAALYVAVMMILCWHTSFVIDEPNGRIIISRGPISFLRKDAKEIRMSQIKYIEKKRFQYIVDYGTGSIKMGRYLRFAKRLEELMISKGKDIKEA